MQPQLYLLRWLRLLFGREFHLSDSMLVWDALFAHGQGLRQNRALRKLFLRENQIGDEGAKALAEGLQHNRALQQLGLDGNQIGDEGKAALEQLIQSKTQLKDDL